MGYTNAPAEKPADEVRFLLQDTDNDNLILTDQEVAYLLSSHDGDTLRAAIVGAETIATKYAHEATMSTSGDVHLDLRKRADMVARRAAELRQRLAAEGLTVTDTAIASMFGLPAAAIRDPIWWFGRDDTPPVTTPNV